MVFVTDCSIQNIFTETANILSDSKLRHCLLHIFNNAKICLANADNSRQKARFLLDKCLCHDAEITISSLRRCVPACAAATGAHILRTVPMATSATVVSLDTFVQPGATSASSHSLPHLRYLEHQGQIHVRAFQTLLIYRTYPALLQIHKASATLGQALLKR